MSLVIRELTKVYGTQHALNAISFEVKQGEIAAFLGPNGAGKSTTMKIATGFLAATSGTVLINGMDVSTRPMDVKKIIGYLPEHNPLYTDMFVHEYLAFTGRLYGLYGKSMKSRIGQMIELCGLAPEQNKKIEKLSKGYRQRVGLAQALLHDPEVLILDEPTSGLDPNQLVEIRNLIKQVSRNKTVLFSTHIMQEVQALCDRVIVINKGKLVADDLLSRLMNRTGKSRVVIAEFETAFSSTIFEAIRGIERVSLINDRTARIEWSGADDVRPEIFRVASENGLALVGLKLEQAGLEGIFKELTNPEVHVQK
ncbi:gliding motility-associated ABC transporter ATP-binding subunit GldA [Oscillatoria amoena NRMC-F 0135]|nr:gliding motility-associated ABC transporter ATP-binding subunit GldA [Oscillatoria amoena NRMC-F 0135]